METEKVDKQSRRWFFTINNPFWTDDMQEVDISKTDLPIVQDHYCYEIVKSDANKGLFVFKHIEITNDNEQVIIERPYFKDYDSVRQYIENLEHRKWSVFQLEKGESGTPHIQGGITFTIGKRFKTIQSYFPTAMIDRARGTNTDIKIYCTKLEGRVMDPVEIGKFVEMRDRTDYDGFFARLDEGATNAELKSEYLNLFVQFGVEKVERFRQDIFKDKYGNEYRDIKVTYIYGGTRLGKTTYVLNKYPLRDICRVNNYKVGTFEGYINQKVLVLDEFTGKLDITFVNNLLDRLPLDLPARFTNRIACFNEVYLISNLPLSELYKDEQKETPEVYRAFTERIHDIIKFTGKGKWQYEQQNGMTVVTDEDLPW